MIHEGVYDERIDVEVSGNAVDGPIVFRGFGDERPTISGSRCATKCEMRSENG